MLESLSALSRATLRLWELDGGEWRLIAGPSAGTDAPRAPRSDTASWLALPQSPGLFLELVPLDATPCEDLAPHVVAIVEGLLEAVRGVAALTTEVASRFEEIDLLYTIGELLGRVGAVDAMADEILREVTAVIGARRAGLRVYDPGLQVLRSVAILGSEPGAVPLDVPIDAPDVVVARAFRSGRVESGTQPDWVPGEVVAVPISYAAAGEASRVVGTLTLADRAGGGRFTRDEIKLIAAIASQIGAALENARLAARDRERARLEQELRLARELQIRLMPTPAVLRGEADVAVRSEAAESVGGDFFTFTRLGSGRIGVMLGDVASHGFAAALIAAEVLAAVGIHANSRTPPDETLALLRGSLLAELEKTEMHLSIFYGILDPGAGRLVYSNAGHPHAFRIPHTGSAERLDPTAPPLGLAESAHFGRVMTPWRFHEDLLVLFTDGLQDHENEAGERFGEPRLLARIEAERHRAPSEIVELVFQDLADFGGVAADDRTLLVLRM